jgi:hypothetical protein
MPLTFLSGIFLCVALFVLCQSGVYELPLVRQHTKNKISHHFERTCGTISPAGHGSNPCDEALIPDSATQCKSIRDVYALAGDMEGEFLANAQNCFFVFFFRVGGGG